MAATEQTRAKLVGANIAARRKARGLSQQKLGDRIGKPRHHLSAWENGVHEPELDTLERIAHELDCHWTDFYDPPAAS